VLLAPGPLRAHLHTYVCIVFVPTVTIAGLCKEHPVENILLIIFFMEFGKREMRSHNACLPFIEIGDASP
jgi:hypothetical protein